jgi:hypothetical protein
MMMNRKNLPGVANPMNRALPVVGRTIVAFPNKNMVRPIVSFGKRKIGFV